MAGRCSRSGRGVPVGRALARGGTGGGVRRGRCQRSQRRVLRGPRRRPGRCRERRRDAAVRRGAGRREGADAGRRLARHRGVGSAPRRHRIPHGDDGRANRVGGCGAGRPDDRERVRRRQPHPNETARRHPQPLAARPDPRRLLGRIGRRGRRWDLPDRHRRRRRWLDPHPRRLHRARRTEGHLRTHSPRPARRVREPDRVDRVHGPLGARHGPVVRRHERARSPRPAESPSGRGLGGRSRHPSRRAALDAASPWSTIGAAQPCHRSCGSCWRRRRAR